MWGLAFGISIAGLNASSALFPLIVAMFVPIWWQVMLFFASMSIISLVLSILLNVHDRLHFRVLNLPEALRQGKMLL
jgi:hypothetical protein